MKETILAVLLAPIITAFLLLVGWPIYLDYQKEVERIEIVRKERMDISNLEYIELKVSVSIEVP